MVTKLHRLTMAFDDGLRAVGEGRPKSANPYPRGTTDYAAWNSGYDIATADL